MEIRRIRDTEGLRLRALRLRALADAPTAFGTTLAEEQTRPPTDWERFAREAATSEATARFIAEEDGGWYGLVGCYLVHDHPRTVQLVAMWVDPDRRRSGIGGSLVDAVIEWARGHAATRVQLWVTETNEPARALYARYGFAPTGPTQPLPSHPTLREVLMVRELM